MSSNNRAYVIAAAIAAGLALMAVVVVSVVAIMHDPPSVVEPVSGAAGRDVASPVSAPATVLELPEVEIPVAIPRATVAPVATAEGGLQPSEQPGRAVESGSSAPVATGSDSGVAALASSRVIRTLLLSDDQLLRLEQFEREFDIAATQRLEASSAMVRRAGRQFQAPVSPADGHGDGRVNGLAGLREALGVHRQVIEALEQEYLAGVRPLLDGGQFEELSRKVAERPHVSGLVKVQQEQDEIQLAAPVADE